MQRTVRLSLAGLLTFAGAGLTACGDKVTVPPPIAPDSSVQSVRVAPPAASVAVGGTTQLAASVVAGSGQHNRTVTWSSSDAATASVDQTGKVTGVKGGSVTIIAKSVADPTVSGASAITITGGGVPTVTISSIVQTSGGTSSAADLSNAKGQLDITLNVEPNGQIIKTVTATITCGTKSKSASQTISDVAPSGAASSAVPITLSINTAAFNATTGVPDLNNGNCALSAVATTGTGSQTAQNSTALTLNNTDIVIVKTTNSGASATDFNGQPWVAGNITVSATPILYSGATIANLSITLPGANTPTQSGLTLTAGVASATWSATSSTGANVKGLTLPGPLDANSRPKGVHPTVLLVDAQGNSLSLAQQNSVNESDKRIDNQAPPVPGTAFVAGTQNTQNGWIGAAFTFTQGISIHLDASTDADNDGVIGGVAKVTFTTQSSPTGAATWTTFASPANLAETSTSVAYDLRLVICDALQNCANTAVLTTFGVDKTKPGVSQLAGPKNNDIFNAAQTIPDASFGLVDTSSTAGVSGSGPGSPNGLLVSIQGLNPGTGTSSKTTCPVGVSQGSGSAITCKSQVGSSQNFTPANTAGEYTMVVNAVDQAGNQSDPITIKYYVDQLSPVAPTGGVDILPSSGSINGGSSFSPVNPAVDDMDIAAGNGNLHYDFPDGTGNSFFEAGTVSPIGAAFDNALTRSSKVTVTLATTFFRSLAKATGGAVSGNPGALPTTVGVRVIDAAGNLSASLPVTLQTAALGQPVAISNNSTVNGITNFEIDSIKPALINPGASAVISVNAKAFSTTSGNPLSQVCFYFVATTGTEGGAADASGAARNELVKIGCTTNALTTGDATARFFYYAFTWAPPARFNDNGAIIQAVGSTSAGDALITEAALLNVNPPPP